MEDLKDMSNKEFMIQFSAFEGIRVNGAGLGHEVRDAKPWWDELKRRLEPLDSDKLVELVMDKVKGYGEMNRSRYNDLGMWNTFLRFVENSIEPIIRCFDNRFDASFKRPMRFRITHNPEVGRNSGHGIWNLVLLSLDDKEIQSWTRRNQAGCYEIAKEFAESQGFNPDVENEVDNEPI